MRVPAVAIAFALLAACDPAPGAQGLVPGFQPPPAAPTLPAPEDDACDAAPFAGLIGQPATALERELILRPVRVIRPGMAVTMDFRPNRINFEITPAGTIGRIYCG